MIRKFNIILALALMIALMTGSAALGETAPATLSVTAAGSVTVQADYAILSLGVSTVKPTVAEAASANAATVQQALDALKAAGIDQADIQTEHFQVMPNTDYRYGDGSGQPTIVGYQVTNLLTVTVRDVEKVGAVLDAAMAAGVNEHNGITFRSTKEQDAADEAMKLAVAEGQRKAGLLAAAAGQSLGALTSIQEIAGGHGMVYAAREMTMDANTSILPSGLTVTCTVSLTYQLNP